MRRLVVHDTKKLLMIAAALVFSAFTLSGCSEDSDSGNGSASEEAPFAAQPALPSETPGKSETLRGLYKDTWFFAHDMNFNTLGRGKIMVIDAVAAEPATASVKHYRGQVDADQFATFVQSSKRNELYVAETFYSRGSRGKRTDAVTIYDKDTLQTVGEVLLPNNNRHMSVAQKNAFRLTNDQKFALVFTFTPSTGVAVIDLDSRTLVNEIDIPGCSLIYPAGKRGFASLCGGGGLVAFDLDGRGKVTKTTKVKPFNDIDNDAMFMKAGVVGDLYYFPTYSGNLQTLDLGEGEPVISPKWKFAGESGWGPSGWQVVTADRSGLVYVLMREAVEEGDHKIGGTQVWILDPTKKQVLDKIKLRNGGLSIEATQSQKPLLIVTNADMMLDVYDLSTGEHLREIGGFLSSQAFTLHAVEMPQ